MKIELRTPSLTAKRYTEKEDFLVWPKKEKKLDSEMNTRYWMKTHGGQELKPGSVL